MRKFVFCVVVLLLSYASASAQVGKFRWEDEICVFEGTYNTRLYTKKQLENTYRLWYTRDFDMDTFEATVFEIENIEKLRTAASLDAEYARKSANLKNLAVVNTPFWKEFKAKKLKGMEQEYRLARASVQAYEKPSALREVTYADACVQRFAPPLIAGGDALLTLWREVNEDARTKNADPERVRKDFEAKMASAERVKYAQVEVITFGWWNCVNEKIERGDDSPVPSRNFWKLFKRVKKLGCDYA